MLKITHLFILKISLLAISCMISVSLMAQQSILDRIVAVIGEEVILESDVDNQYNYLLINGQKDNGSLRCQVMDQLIVSKLLLNKADQDSIVVSEEEVNSELERRLQYIMSQMGGQKEFERVYGKSVAQFKVSTRPEIREGLLVDRQRSILMAESSITPREVKKFFNSLDPDSLGFLPAEVQVNHIVIVPPFDNASKLEAKAELKEIRKAVVDEGKDFGLQAIEHSDGPSGPQGGNLGDVYRGMMVPQFEEMVFSMRENEVSPVFETEFGFHIAKVHKIRGQIREISHILKIPKRSSNADSIAIDSLNKILAMIRTDSITFEKAAIRYSQDRATKDCGGCISDPQSKDLRISLDQLDPDLYFKIEEMKDGEISDPTEYRMQDGTRAFHLLYVKKKVPPHVPNLKDDYKKIYVAALKMKQSEKFETWLESAKKNIYIDVKPTECTNALKSWME